MIFPTCKADKMIPFPHQIEGAKFLASSAFAILGDEPRVGKTGAAIMATDMVGAKTVLVVTTASGRGVWRKGFDDWSPMGRPMSIAATKTPSVSAVTIIGWPSISRADHRLPLLAREWDVVIFDEGHYAKSFEAARTQAAFGVLLRDGLVLGRSKSLAAKGKRVWHLTGTPMPNSPFDLYPVLRANAPGRLLANPAKGWPDVTCESVFKKRYCKIKPKKIGHGFTARWIDVIIGGQNLDELRERTEGLILRRTQQDVGIRAPIYETMPLVVTATQKKAVRDAAGDGQKVLAAIESGDTKALEMHLGPLRRLTGGMKAEAIIEAVAEEFESGLDRIVLAYWHRDVGQLLADRLGKYGVTGVDGATPPARRDANVKAFQDGKARVFLGQIQAAGEAIDLSAASELIFVESSFVPAQMKQMSLRVTNHSQARQVRVRVATLDGSIDDAIQTSLLRKWASINEVLTQ
jgi:SWI/SNF-related matrix-associated actin-dependent regulator 1 of chromatin subfamily A